MSNLIACAANTYTTMHYEFRWPRRPSGAYGLNPVIEDPRRRSPPPGMQQSNCLAGWMGQVDGNAIGHRQRQQQPRLLGEVPIEALAQPHRHAGVAVHRDFDPVPLPAHHDPVEPAHAGRQARPLCDPVGGGLAGPGGEPEVGFPSGDARYDAEAASPAIQFVPREGPAVDACLALSMHADPNQPLPSSTRSMRAPRATNRRSIAS